MSSSICAIIVTFNPDAEKLLDLVNRSRDQVDRLVIIDNASASLPQISDVKIIHNEKNEGLAAALNYGIDYALSQGFAYVLLFDQDSKPGPGMVAALHADLAHLQAKGEKVAAIGPSVVDVRDDATLPFVRFGFPLNQRVAVADEPVACDFLITSGVLISAAALKEIGLMREGLFIDNIDMEWCARAKHLGFGLYGSARAKMHHELGDSLFTLPLVNHSVAIHSPSRLYYFMRNRVLLYRLEHVSRVWIAQDLLRVPLKIFIFSVFVPRRLSNLKHMLKGLVHGIAGVEGELASPSAIKKDV